MKPPLQRSSGGLVFHYTWSERLGSERKIVPNAHRASDKFDIAAKRVRSQIHCITNEEPSWRHQRTLTKIQSVSKSDRVYEIIRRRSDEKFRLDFGVGDFHVTDRENQPGLIVFRDLAIEFESPAQFEL